MTSKKTLLDSSSDEEDDNQNESVGGLNINSSYAESYQRFREQEEFQRLKATYGEKAASQKLEDAMEEDSSTDEEEDDDANELTEEVERDFFKTLSYLKKKDPAIYDGTTEFFHAVSNPGPSDSKTKKEKPMTLKDFERKIMLEKGGQFDEMEDEELATKARTSALRLRRHDRKPRSHLGSCEATSTFSGRRYPK